MVSTPHTVKAFDEEQAELRAIIGRMGELAVAALRDALRCVDTGNADGAALVVDADRTIDALEAEAERKAMEMIALRAPLAVDLRELVAALKISGVVERIGDYAKNIARRVPAVKHSRDSIPISLLPEMGRLTVELVQSALEAYRDRDATRAAQVLASDRVIDDYYTIMFRSLLTYMLENPHNISPAAHLLFVGKNLERIGDHATNIAEMVYFAATGERLEDRPRGMDPLAED